MFFSQAACFFEICNVYFLTDFSLLEWKLQNSLPTELSLRYPFSDILLDELGLSSYLTEIPCQINHTEYIAGWKNGNYNIILIYIYSKCLYVQPHFV